MQNETESDEIPSRIIGAIARARKLSPASIHLDVTFSDQGIDSLEALNLLFLLEEEFDVALPDSAQEARKLSDLVPLIRTALATRGASEDPVRGVPAIGTESP